MYYWFCFSVLTGFWECVYVTQFLKVVKTSQILVETNTHVWTNSYGLSMILPWNLSKIFYAEYAAYADREYMTRTDYWSRLIESSHALLCATFSLLSLCFQNKHLFYYSAIAGAVGMGQQFMNSLLYMGQYYLQCRDKDSPNYKCPLFPMGPWMKGRLFMWVNVFWMLMPAYIIAHLLIN